MKKVILTGSSGLIGKEAILPLKELGFEVFAPSSKEMNLFDLNSVKSYFESVKPEYLLHFAWFTGQGYLQSELNTQYKDSSLSMLEVFKKNGGKRAVYAGTCFEYEFKETLLKESDPVNPQTPYAESKNELHEHARKFCNENGISFGWGRIFYVYGRNEAENRLAGALANKLKRDEIVTINSAQLKRDYVYTKDIAGAFAKFLDSKVEGAVNIAKSSALTLGDFSLEFAKQLGKNEFLNIEYQESNQPILIAGDNSRLLNEVGYKFKYSHHQAVSEILEA